MLGDPDIEVVAEAGTGAEALDRAAETTPDVVLLDMNLPDINGLVILQRLKAALVETAVLVFTMHDDTALVRKAVDAGAAGYVLKGASRRELLSAVRAVADGEAVLHPNLLQAILADAPGKPGRGAPPGAADATDLTAVELEALKLIARGLTNRQLAEQLHWSLGTTKKYVQRILEKLNVSDRTQAAVVALRRGLLQ
jgi:DNA-binding NarL/FixJ family response regulator